MLPLFLQTLMGYSATQAGILTYDSIFWLIGLAFLGTIPFLLLLRKPRLSS